MKGGSPSPVPGEAAFTPAPGRGRAGPSGDNSERRLEAARGFELGGRLEGCGGLGFIIVTTVIVEGGAGNLTSHSSRERR